MPFNTLIDKEAVKALIQLKIDASKERRERQRRNTSPSDLAIWEAREGVLNLLSNHLDFIEPAFDGAMRLLKEQGYEIKNTGYLKMVSENGMTGFIRELDRMTNKIVQLQRLYHDGKINPELYDILFK